MQAFFEMEAELSSNRAVSLNEARAMVKNRIEQKKLISRFKAMSAEARNNILNLAENENNTARIAKNISITTGYADSSKDFRYENEITLKNKGIFFTFKIYNYSVIINLIY